MRVVRRLRSREVALVVCFTALYTYFCFVPAFPIIGLSGGAITLAAVMAPIVGLVLGPYLGMLSTFFGGMIGVFFAAPFFPPSLVSGVISAVFAGLLYTNRRDVCIFMYLSLLFFFGFYPFVGPVWLFAPFLWFQIVGFLVLISPLTSMALGNIRSTDGNSRLLSTFFVFFLTSTLIGQVAGSLTFEIISWPVFTEDVNVWRLDWQVLSWIYPVERTIIAISATLVGTVLHRILIHMNLMPLFSRARHADVFRS